MMKKMTFTLVALATVLLALSPKAIAQEILAEEVESFSLQSFLFQESGPTGTMKVTGQPSPAQYFNRVKAVKCQASESGGTVTAMRESCGDAVYFGLNESATLAAGYYLVGFENTIYPGFVKVVAGQETTIALQRIALDGNGTAKVYRNLTKSIEQKKMYFTQYQIGRSFFSLAEYDFGDLYLRKYPMKDLMPNIEYSFCNVNWTDTMEPQASSLCRAYKSRGFMSMRPFFSFDSDSTHTQYVPRVPGDAFPYTLKRLLVSAPVSGSGQFVNVLPGEYVIDRTVGSKSTKTEVSLTKDSSGNTISNFGAE